MSESPPSATPPFAISNTLGVHGYAARGERITTPSMLKQALQRCVASGLPWLPLGGGSNIVPLTKVDAFVGQIEIRGKDVVTENADEVVVDVGAGEDWHQWVMFALEQGWFGLENLVNIPGSVGGAPIQNIGAYGVEVSHAVVHVKCMDMNGTTHKLSATACKFGYRTSLFKSRKDLTVTTVRFRLAKKPAPNISYPDVSQAILARGIKNPTPRQVADTICSIRTAKLPDPGQHPNVGSFFKNPIVAEHSIAALRKLLPELKYFSAGEGLHKLSAAQLIDSLGWKTRATPNVYCWPQQPLVLVNRQAKHGEDILAFAEQIRQSVRDSYGVELELEPSVLS